MPTRGTTLSGTPSPSQSRQTIPGGDATVVPGGRAPSPAALVASMRPVALGAAPSVAPGRTVVPAAGSTGRTVVPATPTTGPAGTLVPGGAAAASAAVATQTAPPSIESTPVPRVREATPPAADSGVDRTMLIPSPERDAEPVSGTPRPTVLSRTMHLDAGVAGVGGDLPRGPTGWARDASSEADASATGYVAAPVHSGDSSATAAASQPNLMVTQRSHPSQPNLMVTQRARSGAAPAVLAGPGAALDDLEPGAARRRTPVWIPLLIVIVVAALAASAVWFLWGRGRAAAGDPPAADASEHAPSDAPADASAGKGPGTPVEDDAPPKDDEPAGSDAQDAAAATTARGEDAADTPAGDEDSPAEDPAADVAATGADDPVATGDAGSTPDPDAGADTPTGDDTEPSTPRTKTTPKTPKTKARTKTTKTTKSPKDRRETPQPEPRLPGFGHGPVPP